ncbi:MAG: acetyl-CoA carboxylase biotin carboxyl carrier protein subunit [Bacteroidaceae bacterium]|nr:acetyl-CoA carboxylase biotin carboxyl carrier protein subunit [Bacteroidaceae bacterium]
MKEYKYKINGENFNVTINEVNDTTAQVEVNGVTYNVEWEKPEAPKPVVVAKPAAPAVKPATAAPAPAASGTAGGYAIKTPLPGVIIDVKVNVGDTVAKGQTVAILEAMKMENNINSDRDGKVTSISVSKGETVADGAVLITLE